MMLSIAGAWLFVSFYVNNNDDDERDNDDDTDARAIDEIEAGGEFASIVMDVGIGSSSNYGQLPIKPQDADDNEIDGCVDGSDGVDPIDDTHNNIQAQRSVSSNDDADADNAGDQRYLAFPKDNVAPVRTADDYTSFYELATMGEAVELAEK
jgi:hypothetical protein